MFTDNCSFTSLVERQGFAETHELLNTWHTLMFDAIGGQGGVVNQMVGDGLLAIFGAPMPLSDEDGAPRAAVRAALGERVATVALGPVDLRGKQRVVEA